MNKPSLNIIFDLRNVLFSYHPEHRGTKQQFAAIKQMVAVLHQISAQTNPQGAKRHRLFVLSNASIDSYQNFITHHSTIFSYFDGIVTSAQSGFEKPDQTAYHYILKKYKLLPHTCVFIDDKQINVTSAQATGMNGITYENAAQVTQELKKYKVL